MRPHVRNYYHAFGYDESSFVPCEICGRPSNDIHHIEPRSKFGSKNYGLMDSVQNLIALCRLHHTEAHGVNSRDVKQQLKEIVNRRGNGKCDPMLQQGRAAKVVGSNPSHTSWKE